MQGKKPNFIHDRKFDWDCYKQFCKHCKPYESLNPAPLLTLTILEAIVVQGVS
jgi:hypothetical protein